MERIREVLAAQDRYWRFYGGPSEEDHSLNNMNRDLIEAMNGHYGQVYVGSINGDLVLVQYNSEKIYNFAYDFCVPQYDAELETLLRQWKAKHKVCQLESIHARIRELNGHLLIGYDSARRWSNPSGYYLDKLCIAAALKRYPCKIKEKSI